MKKLLNYIKLHGSVAQAARELNVSRTHLSNIIYEKYPPGRKLAIRIQEWSRGAVSASELLNLKEPCQCDKQKEQERSRS
jgi:plasmid maintenance system antidote protein VapI